MKKLFKKNVNLETAKVQNAPKEFLSAQDALNLADENYTTVPTDEIFTKIEEKARSGFRYAYFMHVYITGAQKKQLEELGYTIDISILESLAPYFKVSW